MTAHHQYQIGDVALSQDVDPSRAAAAPSKLAASSFRVGDGAFIRRSDRLWRYAIVSETSFDTTPPFIVFTVTADGSTKKVGPSHWGDRLRPLLKPKRQRSIFTGTGGSLRRNNLASLGKTKSLQMQSSLDPEQTSTSTFGSQLASLGQTKSLQSSLEPEQTPTSIFESQTSYRTEGSHKSRSGCESESTNDPSETMPKQRQNPPAPSMKKRTSIKDFFVRKFSGGGREATSQPNDDFLDNLEGMKIHEYNDRVDSSIGIEGPKESDAIQAPLNVATEPSTKAKRQRRPNRQARGSFTLTTSTLFKNLMKGAVLGDDNEDLKVGRRATVNNLVDDEKEDPSNISCNDVMQQPSSPSGGKYKPRRNDRRRRATVAAGKPSQAQARDLRAARHSARGTKAGSHGNSPSASFLMKEGFIHLMEEKKKSQQQLQDHVE